MSHQKLSSSKDNLKSISQKTEAIAGKLTSFFICLLVFSLIPTITLAVQKTIRIEWDAHSTLTNVTGYRVYQEGGLVEEINDNNTLNADITIEIDGSTSFTMTSFNSNGDESAHSSPYYIELPPVDNLGNQLPKALMSVDIFPNEIQPTVIFNGIGSSDDDGSITLYQWDFGDGITASGVQVNHQYTSSGIYTVILTVTDNQGATSTDQASISIFDTGNAVNKPPFPQIVTPFNSGKAPFQLEFNGSFSNDIDGIIETFRWDFGDGIVKDGEIVNHTFTAAGDYQVSLTVTDDKGAKVSDSLTISVTEPDVGFIDKPIASIEADIENSSLPITVQFDGTGSYDPDGFITNYVWQFGDGSTSGSSGWNMTGNQNASQNEIISHTYEDYGQYTIKLSVIDDQGNIADSQLTIVVNEEGGSQIAGTNTVNINLTSGWNLVSFPLNAQNSSPGAILNSVAGKYSTIWTFTEGKWMMYNPQYAPFSDLVSIDPKSGYWINMTQPSQLTLSGTQVTDSSMLKLGWNLISFKGMTQQNISDALSSINGKYISVWSFTNGAWQAYDPNYPNSSSLTQMKPGAGYWVNVSEACSLITQ